MSSLPVQPTLAPIIEPSEEFEYKEYRDRKPSAEYRDHKPSALTEMCLDHVPIRELTGLAAIFGIDQENCFEASELRRKIE